MTSWVIFQLLDKYNLNPDVVTIKILTAATTSCLGGTSAELLAGDNLTVTELLHGMMLPSGNDAAQSLAIYFGNYISQI